MKLRPPGRRGEASIEVELDSVEMEGDEPPRQPAPRASRERSRAAEVDEAALLPVAIPDRRYFRIGEVASLLSVKPHVLRYWESEFRGLRPKKSRQGQRLYRRRDVELLVTIRRLLHGERYTIAGARERMREIDRGEAPAPDSLTPRIQRLERIQAELEDLQRLIDRRERDLSRMSGGLGN